MVVQRKNKTSAADHLVVDELPPVTGYLSSGCTILDLAVANRYPGGFPAGRITHIWGAESSAKSVLVAEPLGAVQRQGGYAWMVDVEGTFDFTRAHLFGVDTQYLNYLSGLDSEKDLSIQIFFNEILSKAIKEAQDVEEPSAMAVDSLSALASSEELAKDVGDTGYGTSRASALSEAFRKHIWSLARVNLALIFIDQQRQKIGGYGGKTFSGGEALKFYASTRIRTWVAKIIPNEFGKPIGIKIGFKVEKNKVGPPFREGEMTLMFDYGIDNIATNLEWYRDNVAEMSEKKGKPWFECPDGKKFQTLDDAVWHVEDRALEVELDAMVVKLWRQVYASPDRKERVR